MIENSVSPGVKVEVSQIVESAGGRYIEGAIMSPINPKRAASPMLLGGPHAAEFLPIARQLGFTGASVFSDRIGGASAAKMCRSVIIKGIESLAVESMLAARHFGAEDQVLASLSETFPGMGWDKDLPDYLISRVAEHGHRDRAASGGRVHDHLQTLVQRRRMHVDIAGFQTFLDAAELTLDTQDARARHGRG